MDLIFTEFLYGFDHGENILQGYIRGLVRVMKKPVSIGEKLPDFINLAKIAGIR